MTSTMGPVEGLEVVHEHAEPVDRGDLDAVEPDRVGRSWDRVLNTPVSGLRGSSRVDGQHIAPRATQPGQDEDLGTDGQVADGFHHPRIEHQPCVRRALEPLLWCALAIDKTTRHTRPALTRRRVMTAAPWSRRMAPHGRGGGGR